jgi:hypothetical protein
LKSSKSALRVASELVVIVVGILLALTADSWWESRADARLEREYLVAFRQDVQQTIAENRRVIGTQEEERHKMLQIAQAISTGASLPDTLRRIFPTVTLPAESMDSYRDLVASGGSTLISNQEIRRAMSKLLERVEYNDRAEAWALDLITSMRTIILSTEPGSMTRERLAEIWSVYTDAGDRLLDGKRRLGAVADLALVVLNKELGG